jgi:vesicle-fusing ATPase
VLATTSERSVLQQLDVFDGFDKEIPVGNVEDLQQLSDILRSSSLFEDDGQISHCLRQIQQTSGGSKVSVGIKRILLGIETARKAQDKSTTFAEIICSAIPRYSNASMGDSFQ